MPPMIIKSDRRMPHTVIATEAVNDCRLSAGAMATLAYLMSKPEGWQVYATQIANRYRCNRHTAQRYIDELMSAGYVVRRERAKTRGKSTYDYAVSDSPDNISSGQILATSNITGLKINAQVKRCMDDLRMYMAMYQLVPSEPIEHIKAQIRQIVRSGITPRVFALYTLDYMHGTTGRVDMQAFAADAVNTLTYNSVPARTGKYDDCMVEVD